VELTLQAAKRSAVAGALDTDVTWTIIGRHGPAALRPTTTGGTRVLRTRSSSLIELCCAAGSIAGGSAEPRPAAVMTHGFSGTITMVADKFAEVFAEGFVVLLYDDAGFRITDGAPRRVINSWMQACGYRMRLLTFTQAPDLLQRIITCGVLDLLLYLLPHPANR
jgi:hypothetical protein